MDGYATLNHHQLEGALNTAIVNAMQAEREWAALDKLKNEEEMLEIWEERHWLFGPWTMKGAERRRMGRLGMFGNTHEQVQRFHCENVIKELKALEASLRHYNAEPYLLGLKVYQNLMKWQEPQTVE